MDTLPPTSTNAGLARLYAGYAATLLALTLVAGLYLRAAMVWPAVRGGLGTPEVIHAHSHVGFFGWMVMAAAAALLLRTPAAGAKRRRVHLLLAHAIGIASAAAFVGFALRGYDMVTITISAIHVGLWLGLAAALWRPLRAMANADASLLLRAGLGFLVLSGVATVVPAVMMVQAVTDPWLVQLGVKLFLTPFVSGFLLLTAMGLVYDRLGATRNATTVLFMITAGTLPSTLLYIPNAPEPWLVLVGRVGIGVVGAGVVLFASDVAATLLANRRTPAQQRAATPLVMLAGASAAVAGGVKLLASAGVGASFMHNRSITVAVLHLILLGIVTPALLAGLRPGRVAVRTTLFAAGLALMLAPLAAAGWPQAVRFLMMRGVSIDTLLVTAVAGGALTTVALLALMAPGTLLQMGSQGESSPAAAARVVDTDATTRLAPSASSRRTRTPAPLSSTNTDPATVATPDGRQPSSLV